MNFDIFTIRQWREGYTLHVGASRPHNAPRYRHTKADMKRNRAVNKKNQELNEHVFATLEEVFEEIKRLEIPSGENDEK
jgi:hypothetical protein